MPFEPHILRFDEPAGGPAAERGRAHAEPMAIRPEDIDSDVCDTVSGLEMATVRDWRADDDVLGAEPLQLLARQLSDDAARLAERYPARGEFGPRPERHAEANGTRRWVWYRLLAGCLFVAFCGWGGWHAASPFEKGPFERVRFESSSGESRKPAGFAAAQPTALDGRMSYEDGDEAAWGTVPLDRPVDTLSGGWPNGFYPATGNAWQGQMFDDSQGYCEVSM